MTVETAIRERFKPATADLLLRVLAAGGDLLCEVFAEDCDGDECLLCQTDSEVCHAEPLAEDQYGLADVVAFAGAAPDDLARDLVAAGWREVPDTYCNTTAYRM